MDADPVKLWGTFAALAATVVGTAPVITCATPLANSHEEEHHRSHHLGRLLSFKERVNVVR